MRFLAATALAKPKLSRCHRNRSSVFSRRRDPAAAAPTEEQLADAKAVMAEYAKQRAAQKADAQKAAATPEELWKIVASVQARAVLPPLEYDHAWSS